MKEIYLTLKENEVAAMIFALNNFEQPVFWGSVNTVSYKELIEKITDEALKQLTPSE